MERKDAIKTIKEAESCFCKHGAYKDCHSGCKYREALDAAVKALEQEPCEDAISRQEVLYLVEDYDLSMGQVVKGIHALPSVTPQEPILDTIRAEIKAKQDAILYGYDHYDDGVMDGLDCALEIIDKAETEDTDG